MQKRRGLINFLIVLVLLVVFVVGCSVLLRAGGSGGGGDGAAEEGGDATTMTFQQFESVDIGSMRQEIIDEFGEPTPRQQVLQAGVIPDDPSTLGCIYYRADPPTFGEWFEFCFEGDTLTNKTSL